MIKHILDKNDRLIARQECVPECGKDFCDTCGDCLACYSGDPCPSTDGKHLWIQYLEENENNKSK